MTEPVPNALDLLKRTESLLSALHGSVARHDNLAANLGCAGCELRDQIRAALAAPAAVPPPASADRAAVLCEAADELGRMDYDADSNDYGYDTYRDAWNGGVMDGADMLRRLAAETQPSEPPRPHPAVDALAAVLALFPTDLNPAGPAVQSRHAPAELIQRWRQVAASADVQTDEETSR